MQDIDEFGYCAAVQMVQSCSHMLSRQVPPACVLVMNWMAGGTRRSSLGEGMCVAPVLGNVDAARDPDLVVRLYVVEKARQCGGPAWPSNQAAMQPERQHFR